MSVNYVAREPKGFSASEIDQFVELIKCGDEVDSIVLRENLEKAKAIVCALDEHGQLLGLAALKHPQKSYRKRVSEKSGFDLDDEVYPFELGYIFVKKKARGKGISHQLVDSAMARSNGRSLFATVRTNNKGMLKVLKRSGFAEVGSAYPGQKPNDWIQVLVCPTPLAATFRNQCS